MPRTVALITNPEKPEAQEALAEVRALLSKHGKLLGECTSAATKETDANTKLLTNAEVIVVLGGDGTLLSQARRFARPTTALLGVNMGRLGFLANFDLAALKQHAGAILQDERKALDVREYNLLRVRVYRDGQSAPVFESLALNDAVITAGPPYRLITLAQSDWIDCVQLVGGWAHSCSGA
jgi:NAD+ kinase